MSLHVITPAAEPVVTLAEAKAYLRVDLGTDDAVISQLIAAVTDWLAGPEGWLGRSLAPQTLELRLPCFPSHSDGIILPRPPLIEVESVTYQAYGGDDTTVDPSACRTFVGSDGLPRVAPQRDAYWPGGVDLRIRYRAGYEDGSVSPAEVTVPEGIRTAMLRMVAALYEDRDSGRGFDEPMAKMLFRTYRVFT